MRIAYCIEKQGQNFLVVKGHLFELLDGTKLAIYQNKAGQWITEPQTHKSWDDSPVSAAKAYFKTIFDELMKAKKSVDDAVDTFIALSTPLPTYHGKVAA